MSQFEGTIRCDGCGVEILLSPIIKAQQTYCCPDCANGLECDCARQVEMEEFEPGRKVDNLNIDLEV